MDSDETGRRQDMGAENAAVRYSFDHPFGVASCAPLMTAAERAGYGSQRATSEVLGERLRRARVERWLLEVFGNGKGQ